MRKTLYRFSDRLTPNVGFSIGMTSKKAVNKKGENSVQRTYPLKAQRVRSRDHPFRCFANCTPKRNRSLPFSISDSTKWILHTIWFLSGLEVGFVRHFSNLKSGLN